MFCTSSMMFFFCLFSKEWTVSFIMPHSSTMKTRALFIKMCRLCGEFCCFFF
uniref:Uncharacterized protein n=1 Tax=Amphimedon queenslandica TaxID=400682 RepID=A0A1X7VMM2_AMPQE